MFFSCFLKNKDEALYHGKEYFDEGNLRVIIRVIFSSVLDVMNSVPYSHHNTDLQR